jgi:hypothetical protein
MEDKMTKRQLKKLIIRLLLLCRELKPVMTDEQRTTLRAIVDDLNQLYEERQHITLQSIASEEDNDR